MIIELMIGRWIEFGKSW